MVVGETQCRFRRSRNGLTGLAITWASGARSYLLPNRRQQRDGVTASQVATELCSTCFIHYPVGGECTFCSER